MLIYWNPTNRQLDGYLIVGMDPVLRDGETLSEWCQRKQVRVAMGEGTPLWWFYDIFHHRLVLMDSHGMIKEEAVRCSFREARHILRHQA